MKYYTPETCVLLCIVIVGNEFLCMNYCCDWKTHKNSAANFHSFSLSNTPFHGILGSNYIPTYPCRLMSKVGEGDSHLILLYFHFYRNMMQRLGLQLSLSRMPAKNRRPVQRLQFPKEMFPFKRWMNPP